MSRKNEMKKTDTDGGGVGCTIIKMEDERLLLVSNLGIFSEKLTYFEVVGRAGKEDS